VFGESQCADAPIVVSGKFLRAGTSKWYARGLTYGPFAPNERAEALPSPEQVRRDFAMMRVLGANCLRLYFPPPDWLLDCACEFDLRVLIDVPWEKHRCFFEDWAAMDQAREQVRQVARHEGKHPAVFAISVVNEFPNDIVRFYGRHRLEQFVDELLDIVHHEAPECLATFANFPTTEFLQPRNVDFHCFNVYLHEPDVLGVYLDRLQHLADSKPLLLGEYGIDSTREGEDHQAELLREHVDTVFSHGLAGSFVFAFTDDWFTGGHQIEDWMFGVTRVDRSPKLAASAIQQAWKDVPEQLLPENAPMVSVVVCSYNGARTLEGCLDSLMRLNYPDYEVILIDDGSQDATPEIARRFPQVRTIQQDNQGLSAARNVGARAARGEILAYTDDDCVADEDWLLYLVRAMLDQDVVALGGPNITPRDDGWVAHCVAASPGNPSHVMLDDRRAEHVPGCNMVVRRDVLLDLGGFDPQYRAAGDDVDVCWRLLDAGYDIGFAPGALVWHHRRCTVRAYLKQQKGYGRAEAMVQFKHPQRFSPGGNPLFRGVLYGDGAVGVPVVAPRIYHGQFGLAPFQTMYRQQVYGLSCWVTSLAWHGLAGFLVLLSLIVVWLWIVPVAMWTATLMSVVRAGLEARLPANAPLWCRPLVMLLHLIQPVVRGGHRLWYRWTHKRIPAIVAADVPRTAEVRKISSTTRDLYWENRWGIGREQLLQAIVDEANAHFWPGDFDGGWVEWDVELTGDMWHKIHLRTATEELGWPRRFTRARCTMTLTATTRYVIVMAMFWTLASLLSGSVWGSLAGLVIGTGVATSVVLSRRRCLQAATDLLHRAACRAGLSVPDDPRGLEVSIAAETHPPASASARVPAVALATTGGPNR
jgi:O-antigen biosynthesis protein